MKKGIILSSFLTIILSVGLTGCASMSPVQPLPYSVKTDDNSFVTWNEKKAIFTKTLELKHKLNIFFPNKKHGKKYKFPSRLDYRTISYEGLNATFAHKFDLNSAGEIYRIDESSSTHSDQVGIDAYCALCDDYGFSNYINNFQSDLVESFNKHINKYAKFKKNYLLEKNNFNKKYNAIDISVVDMTGFLRPENIKMLKMGAKKESYVKELNINSLFYSDLDSLDSHFGIRVTPIHKLGRYYVYYDNKHKWISSNQWKPSDNQIKVASIKFDYIPDMYSLNDSSIDVTVNDGVMSIVNKTNNFINIESLSAYYNQDIETQENINWKMPPKSKRQYSLNSFKYIHNKRVAVISKNQKVNFGFAVSYFNQYLDKRSTVFKTHGYSINNY